MKRQKKIQAEGFITNIETAMAFFTYCQAHNVTDPDERLAVMRQLVAKKKAGYIRDVSEFMKDKTVLKIKKVK